MQHYDIVATWDDEAEVYVAQCDALGLITEAPTYDALIEKLEVIVPELVVLNNVVRPGENLSVGVVTKRQMTMARAA